MQCSKPRGDRGDNTEFFTVINVARVKLCPAGLSKFTTPESEYIPNGLGRWLGDTVAFAPAQLYQSHLDFREKIYSRSI